MTVTNSYQLEVHTEENYILKKFEASPKDIHIEDVEHGRTVAVYDGPEIRLETFIPADTPYSLTTEG